MAFDRQQNLYVGDRSGTIFKIAPDRQIFVFATLEPSVSAYHLAFGPHGDLFVSGPTTSSFDSIYKVDPHGSVSVFYRGLGRPQGMAFDEDGNLYVAASLSGKRGIVKITPDAKATLQVSGQGLVGLAFAPGKSAILATNNAVHNISWNIQGLPLIPD
jgi:sugar lactone lactonase YvrE